MKRAFAHIGFSFALTLIVLNFLNVKWALAAAVAAGALFIASLLIGKTRRAVAVPLCLFSIMISALMFSADYYTNYAPQAQLANKNALADFYIVDMEKKTENGYSYTVKTNAIRINGAPQNIKLRLYTYTPLDADYYELLQGELKFTDYAEDAYNSYGAYADKVFLKATPADDIVSTGELVNNSLRYVLDFRFHLRSVFSAYIGGDEGALALAVLTGNKSDLGAEVYEGFKASGLAHLVAVSGLHLMVLSGTAYYFLRRLSVPVVPRCALSGVLVLFYIMLSGFAPSMIRAGIMMLVFLIGKASRQKSDSLNSLGLAAFLVCFFNPFAVTDAGAMLSYTAVLGILTLNKPLRRYFKADRIKNKVFAFAADGIILSLSVFLATLPVMMFFFGQASIIGLLISFLSIPLAQVVLITSFLFIPLYKVKLISAALVFVIRLFAGLLIKLATDAAGIAFSMIYLDYSYIALAVAFVFAIFGVGFIFRRRKSMRLCALLSSVTFCIICILGAFADMNKTHVRAIAGVNSTAYIVYDDNYAFVAGVNEFSQVYSAKHIINANRLSLLLVLDNCSSEKAQSLAESCSAVNYICTSDKNLPQKLGDCKNILSLSEFDVDLWQGVNVKYNESVVNVTVNGSEYTFDNNSFSQPVQYDYIITVESGGSGHYRRLNKWQD